MTQPDRNPAVPHELLLGQAGFLRRLARDLVRDPHAADDALQDTWLAALEHPPRHQANLRAWLATILRNVIAQRGLARGRREHHEAQAGLADTERKAGGGSGETVRLVTDLVLALEEPYQSTILARYFEELTPAQIAEREHLPVATVKSRLQRALEMLRERMQRQQGRQWTNDLVALLAPKAIGKGALLVSLKTKIAVAGVLLALGWLALRQAGGSREPAADSLVEDALDTGTPPTSTSRPDPLDAAEAPGERAPATTAESRPTAFATVGIFGTLTDPVGRPIGGSPSGGVALFDGRGERRSAKSAEDGGYLLADLQPGRYWLTAGGSGYRPVDRTVDITGNESRVRCDFTLQCWPSVRVFATTPEGTDLFEALSALEEHSHRPIVPVATTTAPGEWFTELRNSPNNPFGVGQFLTQSRDGSTLPAGCMGQLELHGEAPVFLSLVHGHRVLQTRELHPGEEEVRFVLAAQDVIASSASFAAQIFDARTGAPIPRAHMSFAPSTVGGGTILGSDAEGRIVVRNHAPCDLCVSFGARGYESCVRRFRAEAGREVDLGRIELGPAVPIEARVVDEDGTTCNASLHLALVDEPGHLLELDENTTYGTRAGVLQIGDLGPRLYVLRTGNHGWVADAGGTQPQRVSGNVLVDLRTGAAPRDLTIRLRWATPVALHVGDGAEAGLRFRVLDEHGLELVGGAFTGSRPRGLSLPPGQYRVLLLDAGGALLSERVLAVGGEPLTVELSR